MFKLLRYLIIGTIVAAACPALSSAPAQDISALGRLLSCQNTSDSSARLACFDSESIALRREVESGDLVPVYKREVETARRGLFGIDNVRLPSFLDNDRSDLRQIETTITTATRGPTGRWRFELEDGSRWDQIDSVDPHFSTRPGTPVRIRKAAMGSYLLTIGRATPLRVSRRS